MSMKTRKMSIKFKILIPSAILIILICVIVGSSAYKKVEKKMINMGIEQAEVAAQVTQNQLDVDKLKTISKGDEQSEAYQDVLKKLRSIKETCNVAYCYTLYTDGTDVYYHIDTDETENQAAIGQKFEYSYKDLESVFKGEEKVQNYIESNKYGDLISVYVPIEDKDGTIIGALGCDYNATEILNNLKEMLKMFIWVGTICGIAAIIILNIIVGRIIKNLRTVNEKIYDLVNNEGDLTQELEVSTGDEMELIADNVNALLKYIRTIMLHISQNSTQLNSSSRAVVNNISAAEVGITDVSATMEQMSAAMEETTASISQISEAIGRVNTEIEQIADRAKEGNTLSEQIQSNAGDIRTSAVATEQTAKEQANQMAERVSQKIQKSKAVEEISMLTANILNITAQTNLLALNASIEAARAGEAGKGFAVVADEIGKLATDSAEAASQIEQVSNDVIIAVNELAKEAEVMIEFMEKTAMNGYQQLVETSEGYSNEVVSINEMMQNFAEASASLYKNMEDINESVEAVNTAIEETTKGVINVSETSVDLTESVSGIGNEANSNMGIAEQLNSEVGKFKLQ